MDGPGDYHTRWSQTKKDKYYLISLICRILKKWYKWFFELVYKAEPDHRLRELTYGYQGRWGVEKVQGKGKLGVWDWQGSTIQHRELCSIFCNNLNGKTMWKRIDECICITESFCYTPETNPALFINYVPILKKNKHDLF